VVRKRDIRLMDEIVKKVGLSREQRRLFARRDHRPEAVLSADRGNGGRDKEGVRETALTTTTDILAQEIAGAEIKSALLGKKCWHGYVSAGNTFQIALGRKVPLKGDQLAMKEHLAARRAERGIVAPPRMAVLDRFTGESNLLVWCSWRLDRRNRPLTSWDDAAGCCEAGMDRLVGRTIKAVEIAPGWDLRVQFSGELLLAVFADHVGASASFDGNWELWRPDQAYLIGTDLTCEVIDRQNHPLEPASRGGRWRVAEQRTPKR
jgi:hypothetical protein